MEFNWVSCELGDLIELKRGYDLPKSKRSKGKVPIISSSGASGEHNEAKIKGPGVVTGRYGTIGKVFYVEDDYWPLNTTLYVRDFKGNDPLFIHYLLKTISFSDYMDKGAVPGINRNHVHKAKVQAPNCPKVQKALGEELFRFENKIELNQKTNLTLDQMTQSLFKSWFVDFDPIIDNALNSGFDISDFPEELQYRAELRRQAQQLIDYRPLPKDVLNLFPSEFEESELGWIPKGWGVKPANEIAKIAIGKTPPRKQQEWFSNLSEDNIVWVSIRDMGVESAFISDSREYLTPESIYRFNVKVVPKGSVILSFKLTLGRVCITNCDLATNEAIAHFVSPKFGLTKEYIYSYLKTFNYDLLGSTSSIATAVNSKIIKEIPFLVPATNIIAKHREYVESLFAKKLNISEQTRILEKLRDSLLPKLISGEITINKEVT
jgi:type I restriction enzyme S subunit